MPDNYRPTTSLRFVKRNEESTLMADGQRLPPNITRAITRKILQQRWTSDFLGEADEWRDVATTEDGPNNELTGRVTGP